MNLRLGLVSSRKKITVCRSFSFDAAHYLPHHTGKCKNLHGHTWGMEVEVSGMIDDYGMIIDFGVIDQLVNSCVISQFDHKCLNEEGFLNPTCEVLSDWCFDILESAFRMNNVVLERIRVYENPKSFAEVRPQ